LASEAAEQVAAFVIAELQRSKGSCAWQGNWDRSFTVGPACSPSVVAVCQRRLWRVPQLAVEALLAWDQGADVQLLHRVPKPTEVLTLQARGARCVSLVKDAEAEPHASPLAFVVHDLCHLGHFFDAAHFEEQVGFFSTVANALRQRRWQEVERQLDGTWIADRDRVVSDMNGSAVFLLAALKMRLKMAARRAVARRHRVPAASSGALDARELAAYEELFEVWLDAAAIDGRAREAARQTGARRNCDSSAVLLAEWFKAVGRRARADVHSAGS
jgi:hypothetical protein